MSKKQDGILAHRTFVFESFAISSSEFYALLEEALSGRAIPRVKISRVLLSEGGVFGAKREYLRARRGPQVFDVCAGAYGESFMVSWWHRELPSRWGLKILGGLVALFLLLSVLSGSGSRDAAGCLAALTLLLLLFALPLFVMLKVFALIPGGRLIYAVFHAFGSALWGGAKWGVERVRLPTLYQADALSVFETAVPALVEEVMRRAREAQGLRERMPARPELLPGF
jgi:hypothetical protein